MYNGINNRLQGVVDGANNPNSQLGDLHYNPNGKGGVDYTYDGNGNAKTDYNRGIDSINYNCLNLPQQVHVKGKGWINYTYDASGNKLAKQTMDSLSRHATTTVYLNEFVYQHNDTITTPNAGTDTLQFISHEEGRVRWAFHKYLNGSTKYKWEYDFFEKDHLGNIREVLTQEKDTTLYKATMEAAYRATENALFYNIPQTCIGSYYVYGASQPYPSDPNATVPNDSVSRLNGNTPKEGPAIILKVMAGDVFDVSVNALYRSGQTSTGTTDALSDILSALANGLVTVTGGAKGSYSTLSNTTTSPLLPAVNTFRSGNTPTPAVNPKAYLNYMVLDDQFNYDASVSGAIPVNGPDVLLPPLARSGIKIKKNGFLYIYLTNETKNVNVIFDNLSVVHYTGPLLEETHYYPFGLTMAGISDKALKNQYAGNKYKFNGGNELQNQEFSDGSGLEVYDANFRGYDPQIGRFLQQDPLTNAEESWSPYTFVGDNPISFNDPLGLSGQTDDLKGDGEEVLPKIKPKPKPKIKFKTLETAYVVGYKKGCISCKAPFGAGAFPLPMLRPPSPLIVVPETTPGPPGRVIPFNPLPGIGTGIAVEEETSTGLSLLGILGRTFGTIGLVFLPTSAPAEGLHWQPYNSHSNKKDNSNPHIVYVFGFGAKDGKTPILKYGISDEYKWSMDRPENQIDGLRKKYGPTVMYTIYARVINREAASALEAKLTLEHLAIWGDRPREQRRP
jgi:RHS repeat-associated protein